MPRGPLQSPVSGRPGSARSRHEARVRRALLCLCRSLPHCHFASQSTAASHSTATLLPSPTDIVNLTMAHIHIGNATTNGPVLVILVPVGGAPTEVRPPPCSKLLCCGLQGPPCSALLSPAAGCCLLVTKCPVSCSCCAPAGCAGRRPACARGAFLRHHHLHVSLPACARATSYLLASSGQGRQPLYTQPVRQRMPRP